MRRFLSLSTAALLSAASLAAAPRPNVVVILADDMGFSDLGCFGSEIHTPNIDSLAADGVRFTQFYNMARCCPSRAALLTGLYPQQTGMGAMNQDLGLSEYQGVLNDNCVTMADVTRSAGYHTGMVGKWHLCHLTISKGGPESRKLMNFQTDGPISPTKANWPANRGFDQHWGTIAGVENYYDPYSLVHNLDPIKPDKPDFYYTEFITEHAVQLVNDFTADKKPFFMYVAYTAPHWPMQAREADIQAYAHTYDVGWDKIREDRYARQRAMGIIDKQWDLSPRSDYKGLNQGASRQGPWEDATDKPWQARRMATYAAMVTCMDRGVGKILAALHDKQIDQNTVVIFLSDNGGCAENVEPGWYDVPSQTRDGQTIHVGNKPEFMPGPQTVYQSYGPAWANASNTPFRRFKHWTEEGGISTPLIVRWPGVTKPGTIDTTDVGHVIDFMPTVAELSGATYPKTFKGHEIPAEEGHSLVPALQGNPTPRGPLCWEHEGNRAVRVGDFKLVAAFKEPWQLYNLATDRTELHDLSQTMPERVLELKAAYDAWAARCGVAPWPIKVKR